MAGGCARSRCAAEAQRRNRTVCLQLRRACFPLHGRSFDQRHWTSPCHDGKEHRSSAGRRSTTIKKIREQEVESRRKSCTFGRRDQIAFTMTGKNICTVI